MGRQQTQHSLMAIPKVFNSLNSTGYTSQHHAIARNHESFNLFLSSQSVFFLLKYFFRGSATKISVSANLHFHCFVQTGDISFDIHEVSQYQAI